MNFVNKIDLYALKLRVYRIITVEHILSIFENMIHEPELS